MEATPNSLLSLFLVAVSFIYIAVGLAWSFFTVERERHIERSYVKRLQLAADLEYAGVFPRARASISDEKIWTPDKTDGRGVHKGLSMNECQKMIRKNERVEDSSNVFYQ